MTQVDFYLLQENLLTAREHCACRIIDKAYQQGHQVYVQTTTKEEAQRFDELLWTFREHSFIPHHLYGEPATIIPPIQIGWQPLAHEHNDKLDILINLTSALVASYQRFQRIIEIIPNTPSWRTQARQRYRTYREANCVLKTYDLNPSKKDLC